MILQALLLLIFVFNLFSPNSSFEKKIIIWILFFGYCLIKILLALTISLVSKVIITCFIVFTMSLTYKTLSNIEQLYLEHNGRYY